MSTIDLTGQAAPDFTLTATQGESVTLSALKGRKVVLYFYPKDDTPGCTQEACEFRDVNGKLLESGVVVLGVSPDDLKAHQKFTSKYELPFQLLSDTEHVVCEQYGVWKEKSMYGKTFWGVERATFLIDEQGVVVREWRKVKVNGHVEEVVKAIVGN